VKGVAASIKWPNDVWVNGKKLAGMLVDTSVMGSNVGAVIGIGVRSLKDLETSKLIHIFSLVFIFYMNLTRKKNGS
jgi:biotin-(acetyl-CoA carboxylase) ligase